MTTVEWRQSPELVTWARTSHEFGVVLDVVRREIVRLGVATTGDVHRGMSLAYAALESLTQPHEEPRGEPPASYLTNDEEKPTSD